jgi:GntR family transcriptional regulator
MREEAYAAGHGPPSGRREGRSPLPGRREIPLYQRMAELIRGRIMDGTYKAGGRIPSETVLSRSAGLSPLTVRKALRVLVDEGLLERYKGRGTYVTELNYRQALFSMEGLEGLVQSRDLRSRVISADVRRASEKTAAKLMLEPGAPLWRIKRCLRVGEDRPFLVQEGYVVLDPFRPLVEAELSNAYLTGLFSGGGGGLVRTARMWVRPLSLGAENASLLELGEGGPAFQLEYVFHDARGLPIATGTFVCPGGTFALSSTLGFPLQTGEGR